MEPNFKRCGRPSNYTRIALTSGGPEMEPNTDKCGTPSNQQPLTTLSWTCFYIYTTSQGWASGGQVVDLQT